MIFNEIGDSGQLNELLSRRLNLLGAAAAPALMPEIAPILVLENDRPEYSYLKSEYRFSLRSSVAAVAGERPIFYWPLGTQAQRIITVITDIDISAGSNCAFAVDGVGVAPAITGAAIANPAHVDDRNSASMPIAFQSGTNAAIPVATRNYAIARIVALSGVKIDGPFILTGRGGLAIWGNTVNVAADVTIRGYYRKAFPGELV